MKLLSYTLSMPAWFHKEEDGVSTLEWAIILALAAAMCALTLLMGDKISSPDRVKRADRAIKNGFSGIEHNLPG